MAERRILRSDGGTISVAKESRFTTVLPSEDLALGPLVTLATELDVGHGPIDLLAADAKGRLVIVEFKKGTENPDVRKVVAQVLDYGSALWRTSYEQLEERCRHCEPGFEDALVDHVANQLNVIGDGGFDPSVFRKGVETSLDSGNFVFLYVGRDLDSRTKRIMTYLAEGPRMTFFAVEVDYFHDGDPNSAVLVPRTAFVPSWVGAADGRTSRPSLSFDELLTEAPLAVRELVANMDAMAKDLHLVASDTRTGRVYRPRPHEPGVGVYASGRGVEFNLKSFRERGANAFADEFLGTLTRFAGRPVTAREWPAVPCDVLTKEWPRARAEVMEPYFRARSAHFQNSDGSGRNGGSEWRPEVPTRP
jgi:hypothetical protein